MDVNSTYFLPCANAYRFEGGGQLATERCNPSPSTTRNIENRSSGEFVAFVDVDEQCAAGYMGTMCVTCRPNFVKIGHNCVPCPGGATYGAALGAIAVMSCVLFCLLILLFVCRRSSADQAETTSEVFGQIKVLMTFGQILGCMSTVYISVPWPQLFLNISISLNLFNVDLSALFSATACQVSLPFLDGFLVYTAMPFVVVITVLSALIASNICLHTVKQKQRRMEQAFKAAIMLVLLLYP